MASSHRPSSRANASSTVASAPLELEPMSVDSLASVVRATGQPWSSSPTTSVIGTRTSVRNTSLKCAAPLIWRSGRTSTPGDRMSSSRYEMPRCFGASGSVRTSRIARSACRAPDVHTFWPFTTSSSPSRSALVRSAARSEPASGSLNSWHQTSSPRRSGRR